MPELPPECKNWIKVDAQWMEEYVRPYRYRMLGFWQA